MTFIRAGSVAAPGRRAGPSIIVIDGGRIVEILDREPADVRERGDVVDALACAVAPGFVDLHAHGAAGAELGSGEEEAIAAVARFYAAHGVTGFLAGLSGDRAGLLAAISAVLRHTKGPRSGEGASILGIHLEGPFINPAHGGAFAPSSIAAPDLEAFRAYLEAAEGLVRLVTLAPEMPGADAIIREAVSRNVAVSAGHSAATFAQMDAAVALGVRHVTHTYNAMRPLHHREPGILGAALTEDGLTAEAIADGIHVHPAALRLLVRAKGAGRVCLVTDSVGATGLPDGRYNFEGREVFVSGGSVRLADGTLCGSVLTMDRAVSNMVAFGAASKEEALAMASDNPARVVGLGRKGRIEKGMDADLVALEGDMAVAWTMVGGRIVYRRGM